MVGQINEEVEIDPCSVPECDFATYLCGLMGVPLLLSVEHQGFLTAVKTPV